MVSMGQPLDIEQTQRVALEVLNELDRFCRELELQYYLIGGSLIGALRTNNLLAWDDDIDVAMRREDYDRFCHEYVDNERYKLLTYQRGENYRHGMAKLVDNRTVFVEPTTRDEPYGVFVDVFPLDRVRSADDSYVAKLTRRMKVYNYAFVLSPEATRNSVLKDIIRVALTHTIGVSSYKKRMESIEVEMRAGKGECLINYWGAWGKRECSPASCFDGTVPVTIRGKQYPAPIGYDEWLTHVYGDYMSPPKNPPHYHGHAYLKDDGDL